ncbi:hypothetical protein [Caviibacter abscessus]|uniref:hypothetical protein n=1 Tax=Caviibacter abscessus TaxID=1766719 RepID=UPI0012E39FC5|nr:hypothetical protein [Caviibacter abscessus]
MDNNLSFNALKIYILMYDRAKYSKLKDEMGTYIIYSYSEIKKDLNFKCDNQILNSLLELEKCELIRRKLKNRKATHYYITTI